MDTMIIGIAGGTGSGKTTLTRRLKERVGGHVSVLYHDNYYKQHDDMPFEERCKLNYDHPDAFDTDRMIQDIQALRRGETVHCPTYDYTVHNRSAETVEVHPTKVILIEGILIFENKELRDLMDIKIFVDTDADVRILRRPAVWGNKLPCTERREKYAEIGDVPYTGRYGCGIIRT